MRSRHVWCLAGLATIVSVFGTVRGSSGQADQRFYFVSVMKVTDNASYAAPSWSPANDNELAITKTSYEGIYLLSLEGRQIRQLTEDRQAGYKFRWTRDGRHIAYRTRLGDRELQIRLLDVTTGGVTWASESGPDVGLPAEQGISAIAFRANNKKTTRRSLSSTPDARSHPFAYQSDDQIYLSTTGEDKRISAAGDQCFLPVVSPDRGKVLYQEMSKGLCVYHVSSETTLCLGEGSSPCWSPDSRHIVYEVTRDDGHNLLSSDLYIAAWDGSWKSQLGPAPGGLKRRPSWSGDGRRIAFDADGAIYVGVLGRR